MSSSDDTIFTEHIKCLGTKTTEIPKNVRIKLASRLRKMIRNRGLSKASAATFGFSGTYLGDEDVLDELLNDAYCHLFYGVGTNAGKQFAFLQKQVKAGNIIDPLIQRELANYVHDLHRKAFPRDAGVYKNVMAAANSLVENPTNEVTVIDAANRRITLSTLIGMAGDSKLFVDVASIERAIIDSDEWHATLGCVRRFSMKATSGVATGTLAMMHQGIRPLLLQLLKDAIAARAYDPIETAAMASEIDFTDEDSKTPEFVRTIIHEDCYEERQARIDEFVREGKLAIESLGYNSTTTGKLLEILQCYSEKCRHAAPDEIISQEQVRQDVGLKKQTMSDYMGKLRAALETIRS